MRPLISEIRSFAFSYAPKGWALCDGRALPVNDSTMMLYMQIGTTFGGDGTYFKLPDLRDRVVIGSGPDYPAFVRGGEETHQLTQQEMPKHRHRGTASVNGSDSPNPKDHFWPSDAGYMLQSNGSMSDQATEQTGSGIAHNNMSPYLAITYAIALWGELPGRSYPVTDDFIGTIRPFPRNFDAGWWLPCDGTILPVESYRALYSVIGQTFGGPDDKHFALPDLRGRATVNSGEPEGLSPYRMAEKGGEALVKLTPREMPRHSHAALANIRGNTKQPNGQVWANEDGRPPINCFASQKGAGAIMNHAAIGESGGDESHNNMMPYQTMEYRIAAGGDLPFNT